MPADRQAEEDRDPGDRAEDECLGGAHRVRVTLQTPKGGQVARYDGRQWRRGTRSTNTWRRSTSSRSRSASTGRGDGGSPTLASRVAEMLGVSRASAGEMLKRLEADGLVERGERKEAILTATGRARAEQAVRKHRIIERLLTDFMGYTAAEAHVHADELGDTFSDDMVERIDEQARPPRPLPARLAGRHGRRAGREPRARAALGARAGRRARRSCASPSTTATCCTGSTTRASSRAPRSSSSAAEPAAGQFRVALERRREGDRREGRRRPVRPAAAVSGRPSSALRRVAARARPAASRSASALSTRSHVKSWSSRPKWPYAAVFA